MTQHFTRDLRAHLAEHRPSTTIGSWKSPGPLEPSGRSPGPARRERSSAPGQRIGRLPRMRHHLAPTIPAKRKDQAAMKQPPDRDAHPLAGPRPPDYVIVTWVSEQLRDRIQRNNTALTQD